jgi:hypothetical protein
MTETDPNEPAPKIIVDSDWKEQVAQEKEKLAAEGPEPDVAEAGETGEEISAAATVDDGEPSTESAMETASEPTSGPQLPPASFEVLVSMLFTQAIAALGQMPSPSGGDTKIDKPMAKHTIDTLEMLEVKTKSNLSPEETKMLGEALHALRMTYVSVRG